MTAPLNGAVPHKISPAVAEKARLCIRAATMRYEGKTCMTIASELGLPAERVPQAVKAGAMMIGESMLGGPVTEIPDDKARDAAQLRARHVPFAGIAEQLGLPSAAEAKRAAMAGLALPVRENLETLRAETVRELADLTAGLQEIATSPGPLVTESGKIVIDEDTGKPYPNQMARLKALQTIFEVMRLARNLVSRPAYGNLDDLRAEIERLRKEPGEADDGGNT